MIYIGIIIAVCTAEFFLRRRAHQKIELNETREVKGLPVILSRYHNYGMAENRLEERPKIVKTIGAAAVGALTILFLLTLPLRGKKALKTGLALVVGGGLANLLERFYHGYVTDYFQLKVPVARIRKLVFNVADFCIFIGSICIVIAGSIFDRDGVDRPGR